MIVDTSVLVSAERDEIAAEELLGGGEGEVAIAAVTVAELAVGVLLADDERRAAREGFVAGVLERVRIEPYMAEIAREHARLMIATRRAGRPRSAHDLQIAATAIHTRRMLVTHDASGFADLPGIEMRVI